MTSKAALGYADLAEKAGVNQIGTSRKVNIEDAFCCVAKFSAALSDQSKVVAALVLTCEVFGLTKIAMFRILPGVGAPRGIASFSADGHVLAESDAIAALIEHPNLEAGIAQQIETSSGETGVLIVLRAESSGFDIMQLTFPQAVTVASIASVSSIAPAMAVSWRMRQPGLVSALVVSQSRSRRSQDNEHSNVAILGFENAYGLSRAEFRVCRLLGVGLKPNLIARELGLSIATIRSHLRSIYSKTDLSGQIEVVSHIGHSSQANLRVA